MCSTVSVEEACHLHDSVLCHSMVMTHDRGMNDWMMMILKEEARREDRLLLSYIFYGLIPWSTSVRSVTLSLANWRICITRPSEDPCIFHVPESNSTRLRPIPVPVTSTLPLRHQEPTTVARSRAVRQLCKEAGNQAGNQNGDKGYRASWIDLKRKSRYHHVSQNALAETMETIEKP